MKPETKSKLTSRKLWMAIAGVLTVLATDWLKMSPETAKQVIGAVCIIIPAYLAGQGLTDAMEQLAKKR